MCLLALAWNVHPRYRLVLAANRDEFHARPAAPIAPWHEAPAILAGRDLQAGGTWLGLGADRSFGVVTNFREGARPRPAAPSRGGLIPAFLTAHRAAGPFLDGLSDTARTYAGFNLLLGDVRQLWYASNRAEPFARALPAGTYGLSNGLIDTPWPKLLRLRKGLSQWAERGGEHGVEPLLALLADRERAATHQLPRTGLEPEWEHVLSSPFVHHPGYGTRCSTVVLIGHDGSVETVERSFSPDGELTDEAAWRMGPADGAWSGAAAPATATASASAISP
jgi:uncharacterized protein with NRDE domain